MELEVSLGAIEQRVCGANSFGSWEDSPILLKEILVFFILQCIQLIDVLVFESVLVRFALCLDQGFLDQWLGVFGLLGNDPMLTENVIPSNDGTPLLARAHV